MKTEIPRTHTNDPGSSHEAEARARRGMTIRCARLLAEVDALPGLPCSEYANSLRLSDYFYHLDDTARLIEVRRRMSDLKKVHGLVYSVHTKGERESRWFPVESLAARGGGEGE